VLSALEHHTGGVLFQILPECVIGGEEKPGVETLLDGGKPGDIGLREGVEHIMHGIGTAGFVGEPDRTGPVEDHDLVARLGDLAGGKRGRGCRDVVEHLDALIIEHVARDVGGKVGLVEMIGREDLDLAAEHLAAEIFRRHLRGGLAADAGDIGIKARHIEDAAELQRRLRLRIGTGAGDRQHSRENSGENPGKSSFHPNLPIDMPHCFRGLLFGWPNHAACASQRQAARELGSCDRLAIKAFSAKRNGRCMPAPGAAAILVVARLSSHRGLIWINPTSG
jgi:hypothetical protein